MFLVETLTLSVAATALGALLGFLACATVNLSRVEVPEAVQLFLMTNRLHLLVDPTTMLFSILVITSCAMAVSLIPSLLAARLKPVTAMHHVG